MQKIALMCQFYDGENMVADKLNKKFHAFIWLFLIFACFVNAIYEIYANIVVTDVSSRLAIVTLIFDILLEGLLPALFTFLGALVVYSIGFRRYARAISRRDFCYIVMAFTAAVQLVVGLIEAFAILEPDIYAFTSSPVKMFLLTGAYIAAFLIVAKFYRFNPVEAHNAYNMWFAVYMVVLGLLVLGDGLVMLLVTDNSETGALIQEQLLEAGYIVTEIDVAATITTVVIYFVYLAAIIALGVWLTKQANAFRNPETRERFTAAQHNSGKSYADVFGEDMGANGEVNSDDNNSDHVFDEFDI